MHRIPAPAGLESNLSRGGGHPFLTVADDLTLFPGPVSSRSFLLILCQPSTTVEAMTPLRETGFTHVFDECRGHNLSHHAECPGRCIFAGLIISTCSCKHHEIPLDTETQEG